MNTTGKFYKQYLLFRAAGIDAKGAYRYAQICRDEKAPQFSGLFWLNIYSLAGYNERAKKDAETIEETYLNHMRWYAKQKLVQVVASEINSIGTMG